MCCAERENHSTRVRKGEGLRQTEQIKSGSPMM